MYRQTRCKCWLKPAAGIAVPRMSAFFPTYRIEKLSDNSALIDAGVGFQQVHNDFASKPSPILQDAQAARRTTGEPRFLRSPVSHLAVPS